MRRAAAYLLAAVMVFAMTGCVQQEKEPEGSVAFYYRRGEILFGSAHGVLMYEMREVEKSKMDLSQLLALYLAGPRAPELKNVFPEKCRLVSAEVSKDTAKICLDRSFGELEGMELTVACACLSKTVMELTGAASVQISAENTLLAGMEQIVMDAENILLIDQSASATAPTKP